MGEPGKILIQLLDRARACHEGGNGGVGYDELQGRCRKRHAMFRANGFDLCDLFHDLARRRCIIILRAFLRAGGKDARVEAAADNDRRTTRFAERQEGVQRFLFEQGIAPGQQEAVEIVA